MQKSSRRNFVKTAGITAAALNFQVVPSRVFGANEKITLAGIGTAGKGASDIKGSHGAGFQITHLCDIVDVSKYPNIEGRSKPAVGTRRDHPEAKFYEDWRVMLEEEGDKIDAVTVSTPDHVHAHAAIAALKKNCHAYIQKPLTHGIWEARALAKVTEETGMITQMGNQAHAQDHMRRCVELIRAGIIGDVQEVHCWTNRPIWPQAIPEYPKDGGEPPKHINWDLWLGPAAEVAYHEKLAPFNWRGYWNFGTGALGDMACHIMDMAYWAADLGSPISVEAVSADGRGANSDVSPPTWATITYQYPERNGKPPVKFMWYDGYKDAVFDAEKWQLVSSENGLPIGRYRGQENGTRNKPSESILEGQGHTEGSGYGTVIIGSEGKLWFNRSKNTWFVKPGKQIDQMDKVEQTIPRARDQNPHNEFYDAIVANDPKAALSGVWHSGSFTETVLLGNLAVRLGKKVEWDGANLKSPNCPEADKLIKREYRKGWELEV